MYHGVEEVNIFHKLREMMWNGKGTYDNIYDCVQTIVTSTDETAKGEKEANNLSK